LFELLDLLLSDITGGDQWPLVVAAHPGVYRLPGLPLQVVALPYLSPSWLRTQSYDVTRSPEEELSGLAGLLAQCVEHLYREASSELPAIFAGHIVVKGAH